MHSKQLLALAVAFIILLTGCSVSDDTPSSLLDSGIAPGELYTQALETLTASGNFGLSVVSERIIQIGDQTITEFSENQYRYDGFNSDDIQLSVTQTITYPAGTINISHQYADGLAYMSLEDSLFYTETDYSTYAKTFIPVQLLDESLYESIEAKEQAGQILIGFYGASKPEVWSLPKNTDLISAAGSVRLRDDGTLIESVYNVCGELPGVTICQKVTVRPETAQSISIAAPVDLNACTYVQDLAGPVVLEQCSKLLASVESISSQTDHTISSQVSLLERTVHTAMEYEQTDNGLLAAIATEIQLTDNTRSGSITSTEQLEQFQNGSYTLETDGSIINDPSVNEETMRSYCANQLVSTIPLLQYIEDVETSVLADEIVYTFKASQALADLMCTSACQFLYQDAYVLNELASDYQTNTIVCTLKMDRYTGFPTVSAMIYEGTHTIDGKDYILRNQITQNYTFPS